MVDQEFKKIVADGDMEIIRLALKNTIIPSYRASHNFQELDEYCDYANEHTEGLYDTHDGEDFLRDKGQWNMELLVSEMVTLIDNFSQERLNFIKDICTYLFRNERPLNEGKREAQKDASVAATVGSKSPVNCIFEGIALIKEIIAKSPFTAAGIAIAAGIILAIVNAIMNDKH